MFPHPEVLSDKSQHNTNNSFVKKTGPEPSRSGLQPTPVCPLTPPRSEELLVVAALRARGAACLLLPPLVEEPVVRSLQVLDLHLVIVHPHGCQGTGHFLLGMGMGGEQVYQPQETSPPA